MEHVCKNCGQEFDGKFCNNCGQKFDAPRFTFKHIFEEAFHAFTHADKSFLTYTRKLITNPGKLGYEYIVARKRKKYFNPFTYFLLISAISAFVESFRLQLYEHLFHQHNSYGNILNVYSRAFALVLVPIVALVMWLVHIRKPRLALSEYTVFSMIVWSFYTIVELASSVINTVIVLIGKKEINITGSFVYLLLLISVIAYADYQFHRPANGAFWKSVLVGMMFCACIYGAAVFFIWGYINGFQGLGRFTMWSISVSQGYRGDH